MSIDSAQAARKIFFEVHSGLPREAPGSSESTARALAAAAQLPEAPQVLDIGCGPGAQTLDLARLLPRARITAVDAHGPFVEAAAQKAQAAGIADRVTVAVGDMRRLPYPEQRFDLLWCEGAIYIMGVRNALAAWTRLLKPGGYVGFTEAVWLTDGVPDALRDWWASGYPGMGGIAACIAQAEASGFRVVDHFVLPESDWWDHYYGPLERRLDLLRDRYAADPAALEVLAEHQREVDYFRRWSAHYGYLFVIASKPAAG